MRMRHQPLAILGALLIPLALGAAEPLPLLIREVGLDQRLNEHVPGELAFHDETGRLVRLEEYFASKPVILVLAYYRCPMLCTQVLNGLVESLRAIPLNPGQDFQIVAVSFDPR